MCMYICVCLARVCVPCVYMHTILFDVYMCICMPRTPYISIRICIGFFIDLSILVYVINFIISCVYV